MSAVLVTGGAGFIGSHVVDQLVALGCGVRAVDSLLACAHRGRPDYLNPAADYRWIDLRDEAGLSDALRGVGAVSHQAGMVGLERGIVDAVDYVTHNDLGTAHLLAALHRAGFQGRFALGSSMVVYGDGGYRCPAHGPVRPAPRVRADLAAGRFEPPCPGCDRPLAPEAVTEDAALDPRSIYAATKVHQEHLVRAYARQAGVALTVLRYHNVYGPRMPRDTPYGGVASLFRSALAAGREPGVLEDGGQLRDFVHVEDVARANLVALTQAEAGPLTVNIASGHAVTIAEMAVALSDAFGPESPRPVVTGGYRLGDVRHVFGSVERAATELGFTARVGLAEGMRSFAAGPQRESVGAL